MTIYGRRDLTWKKNELWFKGIMHFWLSGHKNYLGMYYVNWADGSVSHDFYNLTRAKEHTMYLLLGKINPPSEIEA